jgi:hypothetical protein
LRFSDAPSAPDLAVIAIPIKLEQGRLPREILGAVRVLLAGAANMIQPGQAKRA